MNRKEIEQYKNRIVQSLIKNNPLQIILFGSMATGNIHEDSDFDIAIILDMEGLQTDYEAKMALKLSIRKSLGDLSFQIPIDLIVYTKDEFNYLKEQNTSFFQELNETGEILYDRAG